MSDRETILGRLVGQKPEQKPLVYLSDKKAKKDQLIKLFSANLQTAGGEVLKTERKELTSTLEKLQQDSDIILNLSENTLLKSHYPHTYGNSKSMDRISLLIIDGFIGVAENGAVWIPETHLGERRFPFIADRILILLDFQNLVDDLSQAYQKINLSEISFGLWIAGPSKTADIEQSLVIGAQGAMQHTVLIIV